MKERQADFWLQLQHLKRLEIIIPNFTTKTKNVNKQIITDFSKNSPKNQDHMENCQSPNLKTRQIEKMAAKISLLEVKATKHINWKEHLNSNVRELLNVEWANLMVRNSRGPHLNKNPIHSCVFTSGKPTRLS